jgi:hypothetical protein
MHLLKHQFALAENLAWSGLFCVLAGECPNGLSKTDNLIVIDGTGRPMRSADRHAMLLQISQICMIKGANTFSGPKIDAARNTIGINGPLQPIENVVRRIHSLTDLNC